VSGPDLGRAGRSRKGSRRTRPGSRTPRPSVRRTVWTIPSVTSTSTGNVPGNWELPPLAWAVLSWPHVVEPVCHSEYWADPKSGVGYQVQGQVPQSEMASIQDVEHIPVTPGTAFSSFVGRCGSGELRQCRREYHRLNGQRIVTLTANVSGQDLGRVSKQLDEAIQRAGVPPRA